MVVPVPMLGVWIYIVKFAVKINRELFQPFLVDERYYRLVILA